VPFVTYSKELRNIWLWHLRPNSAGPWWGRDDDGDVGKETFPYLPPKISVAPHIYKGTELNDVYHKSIRWGARITVIWTITSHGSGTVVAVVVVAVDGSLVSFMRETGSERRIIIAVGVHRIGQVVWAPVLVDCEHHQCQLKLNSVHYW